MKKHWLFTSLTLLVVTTAMLLLSGCQNTWHGAGRDVERTGEKMQGN